MSWRTHYKTLCGQKELTDEELFGKDAPDPKDDFREALQAGLANPEPEPTLKRLPKRGTLSRKQANLLLYAQNAFSDFAKHEETKRQAKAIKRVNPSPYLIDRRSAQAYLIRALHASDVPLHRDQLIAEMERLGWHSRSNAFNKTKYVERLCHNSEYMLRRTAPATWALRQGFVGR